MSSPVLQRRDAGFTMMEIAMVVVVVGILGAIVFETIDPRRLVVEELYSPSLSPSESGAGS